MPLSKAQLQKFCDRFSKMKTERGTHESQWQELADFILPTRDFTAIRTPGQDRQRYIYENIGMVSAQALASAMHSMLTGRETKWFALRAMNPKKQAQRAVAEWLDDTTDRMLAVFNSERSMFHTNMHEQYLDRVTFGTGIMQPVFHKNRLMFISRDLSECYIDVDDFRQVNVLYRHFKMTLQDVADTFGEDALSPNRRRALQKGDTRQKISILHVVELRDEAARVGAIKTKKKFFSVYVDLQEVSELGEGGFDRFPYIVSRYLLRSGEVYGYAPAHIAKPKIFWLNNMHETLSRAGEKAIDPPYLMPLEALRNPFRMDAGGITYYDSMMAPPGSIFPAVSQSRPEISFELIRAAKEDVERAFMVDWLRLPMLPNMTATEVLNRRDDTLRQLGPVLTRSYQEMFAPLLDRTFDLMYQNNMLAPPPEEIMNVELYIDYVSPMAVAQKQQDIDAMIRTYQTALLFSQTDPHVLRNFNLDEMARYAGVVNNIQTRFINDPSVAQGAREQEAQAQAAMVASETAVNLSKAASQNATAMAG